MADQTETIRPVGMNFRLDFYKPVQLYTTTTSSAHQEGITGRRAKEIFEQPPKIGVAADAPTKQKSNKQRPKALVDSDPLVQSLAEEIRAAETKAKGPSMKMDFNRMVRKNNAIDHVAQ